MLETEYKSDVPKHLLGLVLTLALFMFLCCFLLCVNMNLTRKNHNISKELEQKDEYITKLKYELESYEYLSEKMEAVDDYIQWKDRLILNANVDVSSLERTREEMIQERIDVIRMANVLRVKNE